jgi:hypothetical protein
MIDPTLYLKRVENELRGLRRVSKNSCDDFAKLPRENQLVLAKAIAFLGCTATDVALPNHDVTTREADRIAAVRLMLLKMSVDTGEPRWSSSVLETMIDSVMSIRGALISDVVKAMFAMLGEFETELTPTLAHFCKELIRQSFIKYRASYETSDFEWLVSQVNSRCNSSQAYLALYALPDTDLPGCRETILRTLAPTSFRDEAVANLQDAEL